MEALKGIGVSAGVGVGRAVTARALGTAPDAPRASLEGGCDTELQRIDRAVRAYAARMRELSDSLAERGSIAAAQVVAAHASLAHDPRIRQLASAFVNAGDSAERAMGKACDAMAAQLEAADSQVIAQRGADVRDVCEGILGVLAENGSSAAEPFASERSSGTRDGSGAAFGDDIVIVAHELSPSTVARLAAGEDEQGGKVVGVVAETGGTTSHAALIARSQGIPAVFSARGASAKVPHGVTVVVDGTNGRVLVDPNPQAIELARVRQRQPATELAQWRLRH